RYGEAITMLFHRYWKANTAIARIFNTYGPGMKSDDGRVIPNFITQALTQQSLTVYGEGNQTRSFCYISDLIEGIIRLMHTDYHFPVNLGNPEEISIIELAKLIIRLTQSRSSIIFKPLPQDDPRKRMPDISLARKILNWEPKVSFEEGLRRTISWFKQILRI
ncbi:MAG: GDP-mannose 4,6-dehydratase, partial [Candidatus Omnitrophica bacterium]|nr:GDP-mannose 4,6-dehydratase [Candidatus Omnitrophota bacterium]